MKHLLLVYGRGCVLSKEHIVIFSGDKMEKKYGEMQQLLQNSGNSES